MKSQKCKNEVLFINTEIYISDEASNYIKSLKNVIYHKYINNEKMIEVIRQTKFKRCILLTSSSIIKSSNILELFPNKLFIAPYSTLKSVRKYKNIRFYVGTDEYMFKENFRNQFLGGPSNIAVILEKPNDNNNPLIRKEINSLFLKEHKKREIIKEKTGVDTTFTIFYISDMEKNFKNDGNLSLFKYRRVYYLGMNPNRYLKILNKIKDSVWNKEQNKNGDITIAIAFINYFGIDLELLEKIYKGKSIRSGILNSGASVIGNKFAKKSRNKLIRVLYEKTLTSVTPAISILPAIINIDEKSLLKNSIIYKKNKSNFIVEFDFFNFNF